MPRGTVKFFNTNKGYGFIAPEGGGQDVFVHASALERPGLKPLTEGQRVEFDAEIDRRSGETAIQQNQGGVTKVGPLDLPKPQDRPDKKKPRQNERGMVMRIYNLFRQSNAKARP